LALAVSERAGARTGDCAGHIPAVWGPFGTRPGGLESAGHGASVWI